MRTPPPIFATPSPLRYVTGGGMARMHAADACCGQRLEAVIADALAAGGPIDAPELLPAGAVRIVHGVRFFVQHRRDA